MDIKYQEAANVATGLSGCMTKPNLDILMKYINDRGTSNIHNGVPSGTPDYYSGPKVMTSFVNDPLDPLLTHDLLGSKVKIFV